MSEFTISEIARRVGLRPSAIRYYEQLGILPPALRRSGQRRYNDADLYKLTVVQRARQTGFTLDEIRELFFGFRTGTPAAKRWRQMSRQKLAELDETVEKINAMRDVLHRLENCGCEALNECGRKMLENECVSLR
jgi:MerR family transcriptional regulator, redox-sensitive transcriptional activator SoxR